MNNAFIPMGNTVCLTVSTSSHTPVQVTPSSALAVFQYSIQNVGPNTAFVTMAAPVTNGGGIQSAPSLTAVIPTDGTPANGWAIQSGQRMVVTGPPNAYFAAICAATQSATLYITPGDGIA